MDMTIRTPRGVLPLILSAVLTAPAAWAVQAAQGQSAATPGASGPNDETPALWFVQLQNRPAVEGTPLGILKREKNAFRAEAAKAGLAYRERYAFDGLWNGFSIEIDPRDLARLARIPQVDGLFPVVSIEMPEPVAVQPDLYTALAMTGADIAQNTLGYTGEGVRVAIVDTGIDYDHPDLGGCFGPGCRVAFGYDFVGDDFDGGAGMPVPDDDPDDCQGHGTHVAGITGADGLVTGVAPGVTFGAYRVFGCEGSTWADIMIAAMERALADGMDVLNMSIGAAFQWPQYPTAVAATRLVNSGVVVTASIGNSGTLGTYAAGAPGVGQKVIGVASFENTHLVLPYFEVAGQPVGYYTMTFSEPPPVSGTEEIVYIGRACNVDQLLADPTGKVALIERGACSFAEKALKAVGAGATAAVIHNNAPGLFFGTLGADYGLVAVGISQEDGLFIRGQSAPVMMTWTDQQDSFPNPGGGLIAGGSSYGLAADLSVKPDIGAPGGSIFSTYVMEKAPYATLSGTSMAAPHVAGAAALLLQAKPKTPSQAVGRILQNSADPAPWSLGPSYGLLDNIHRQGAGMLDIDDAILATTKIEPGKIALGESEHGPSVHMLTIENGGSESVTYDLSFESAIATTGTWANQLQFWLSDEDVTFDQPSVTVKKGGEATVKATFQPPTGPDKGLYGGYLVFTPQGGGEALRVPYAGFVGDYQSLPVLGANPYGLPWLMNCQVCTLEDAASTPEFWVNLGHHVRTFRMEVYEAVSGKSWHRVYDIDYVGRNSSAGNIYALP